MQYSIVAVLALAGAAIASPAASSVAAAGYGSAASSAAVAAVTAAPVAGTTTAYSTHVVTLTECASTITDCPARVSTIVLPAGAAYPTGAPGAAYASGTGAYTKPSLTGYKGPAYTGAAGQVKVAGALAGVGAFAALLL